MPDVRVEIAFNAGYVTPSADRVWTDVSEWVELHQGIDIDVGRQDERSTADANQLSLTLDNKDGRFTALRAASPYYPNVKVGRPIRVSVLTQTGHTSVRFVGFIDEWPVEWDGSDAYAKAQIKAASRLSRLGLTAKLKSTIEQEILTDSPAALWTLAEPQGATSAGDSSGRGAAPLTIITGTTPMTFGEGVGPPTDGLTAAQFAGGGVDGDYLQCGSVALTSSTDLAFECWIAATPATGGTPILALTTNTGDQLWVGYSAGATSVNLNGGSVLSATGAVDGALRHIAVEVDRSDNSLRLFVNGALEDSAAATPVAGTSSVTVEVGRNMTGTMALVAVFDSLPGASRWADRYAAGAEGFAGDTTSERLLRILAWPGVPSTEVTTDAGVETMTYQETAGQAVVDALRECESTEGGVLFDGPDGRVKFHNRSRRYTVTPAATLDMAAQHVESDYAPRLDRSTLVNDVTVSNPTTGESARQVDTASSDEYGITTGSATSVADSYTALTEKASWQIASYAEPRMRCPSLTVDVLAHVGLTPSAEDLLDVTVGDLLAVINAPTQSDTTTPSYFVEGYTETIGPESYRITYNTSPTYPTLNTFVLDSATRGLLDTNILAY